MHLQSHQTQRSNFFWWMFGFGCVWDDEPEFTHDLFLTTLSYLTHFSSDVMRLFSQVNRFLLRDNNDKQASIRLWRSTSLRECGTHLSNLLIFPIEWRWCRIVVWDLTFIFSANSREVTWGSSSTNLSNSSSSMTEGRPLLELSKQSFSLFLNFWYQS